MSEQMSAELMAAAQAENLALLRKAHNTLSAEAQLMKARCDLMRAALRWAIENQLVYERSNRTWTHQGTARYSLHDLTQGIPAEYHIIFFEIEREIDLEAVSAA